MKPETILQVAVPTPLHRSFDYLPPSGVSTQDISVGMRVKIPFGKQKLIGLIIGISTNSKVDKQRLKRVFEIIDTQPAIDPQLLELLIWANQYYHHPIGDVISSALPKRIREGHALTLEGTRCWRASESGQQLSLDELKRAPRQAAVLAELRQHPQGLEASQLNARFDNWRQAMTALQNKQLVSEYTKICLQPHAAAAETRNTLNDMQNNAVNAVISKLAHYETFVLEGITGSGKTEVYLHIIEQVLARGQQALVLVPEIGLTPQLVERFQRRFSQPLAVLHSGMSDTERHCAWHMARTGQAGIVIGTRSAVFIPLAKPGVIVVDEEHDSSLKQQEGFRYHARDLAVYRARQYNIPVVLGSATPCLETMYNIEHGKYQRLHLPERAGQARLPSFSVVDMRHQRMTEGLSAGLLRAVKQHVAEGGQVLLFLNRRGYAPTLICHDCGWVATCKRCDAHMTYHAAKNLLRCHHCGAEQRKPQQCPECQGLEEAGELVALGEGTERVEKVLQEHFPDISIARIDRDTTRRKGELEKSLQAIQRGEHRIMVGTQMLSKGHDFPEVTLVGILNVDQGLFSTDFRALERMAQLIVQVAGRAGRADKPGEVVLQTHQPEHPMLGTLLHDGYAAFCRATLQERKAALLPPYSHLALLRAEAAQQQATLSFLGAANKCFAALANKDIHIWGPVPAPMEKRAGRYRAQLLLVSTNRGALKFALDRCTSALYELPEARKVRWTLDVDPVDMY